MGSMQHLRVFLTLLLLTQFVLAFDREFHNELSRILHHKHIEWLWLALRELGGGSNMFYNTSLQINYGTYVCII